jgi:hypothetical protein
MPVPSKRSKRSKCYLCTSGQFNHQSGLDATEQKGKGAGPLEMAHVRIFAVGSQSWFVPFLGRWGGRDAE